MNDKPNIEVEKLKPFTKFIYTLGQLPSSYLASMSYEEQLIWLCNYLAQTVIPTVNNNGAAVTELQKLFTELQDYVNEYFDNLDVQEEIDNKLDEMADQGILADIITQYVQLQGQLTYNTVQEMKEAENIADGCFLKTYGFYNYNDGGGALYKARQITNEDDVDEASIIALNDISLVAELIEKNINPIMFGCYGDNTHDDTIKLQNCINYCINKNLKLTSPKDKIYKISDTIEITSPIFIDFNFATLKAYQSDIALEVNYSSPNELNYYIKNMIIDCNSTCDKGLYVPNCRRTIFEGIKVYNFNLIGMHFGDNGTVGGSRINQCYIDNGNNLIPGTTALLINTSDLFVDSLDWVNVPGGIHKLDGGGGIYSNCHGFIANNMSELYPNSFFFKCSASCNIILDNCYPDTQQYGFIIDNGTSNPRLKINNMISYMNKNVLPQEIITNYGQAKLFYFPNKSQGKRISISNSTINGAVYEDTTNLIDFCNLSENLITMTNTYITKYPLNRVGSVDSLEAPSSSPFTLVSSKIRRTSNTTYISFKGTYNPHTSGKLSRVFTDGGVKVGKYSGSLSTDIELYTIGYYGTLNASNEFLVKGTVIIRNQIISPGVSDNVATDGWLYIGANPDDYNNNTGICDAETDTTYTILGSLSLPSSNM